MIPVARSTLPPVRQVAYLVPDLDAAIAFWVRIMGVGPFRVIPHIRYVECSYLGGPSEVDLSIALAYRDGIQIELMQIHSTAASVFTRDVPAEGGFHHVGIPTQDIARDEATLIGAGLTRLQRNVSSTGVETVFFGGKPGLGIVELIRTVDGGAASERLVQAAAGWDGIEPVLA